jgi:hypothetical protein
MLPKNRPILLSAQMLLAFALVLALTLGAARPASAQALGPPQPVMQNVFFNVVWGAGVGALLGASAASLAAGQQTKPKDLRDNVITGATMGSIAGAAAGVWLLFNGVTFDPDRSLLFGGGGPVAMNPYRPYTPPLVLVSPPGQPFKISGFKALVLDLSF